MSTDLRRIMDVLPVPALVHAGGRVIYGNGRALATLGRSRLDYVALADLVPAEDQERLRADALGVEVRFVSADGRWLTLECSTVEAEDEGSPVLLTTAREVQPERVLRERLAHSDRLAAVGTLAAGVAHEINNPLTFVLTNLDHLREALDTISASATTPVARELAAVAADTKSGVTRIAELVKELRGFARDDDDHRAPVDPRSALAVAMKISQNQIRHRARLVTRLDPTPRVLADEAKLSQVFLNLLVNAAQAIPEGRADANEVRVSTSTDDAGRAVVEIEDTGFGIASADLPRVFEPFFTTKPKGAGTGLGLAVSRDIVSSLGGTITATSTPGIGSTFRVVLPSAVETWAPRAKAPREAKASAGGARVLVIDDEPFIGTAIRRALGRTCEVIIATDGRDALDRLRSGEHFDVVLCDLMMPELSGMELHEELMAHAPDQARTLVFITGGAFTPAARAFFDRVPNARIEKPFDAERLRSLVRQMTATGVARSP